MAQNLPVKLVVPEDQFDDHVRLRDSMGWIPGVGVIALPPGTYGLGETRQFILEHAASKDRDAIIISDDDHRPKAGANMWDLLAAAMAPDVLGVGASRPLTDRFNGGALTRNRGIIMCPGGWGFTVYGLNVRNATHIGGFDPNIHFFGEDAELARNGIAYHQWFWRVSCDVWIEQLNVRNAPGGISSVFNGDAEARAKAERKDRAYLRQMWPEYISRPDQKPRMAWSRMLDDYIPGWRERSALHGGSL
jgi:hypothetical protein